PDTPAPRRTPGSGRLTCSPPDDVPPAAPSPAGRTASDGSWASRLGSAITPTALSGSSYVLARIGIYRARRGVALPSTSPWTGGAASAPGSPAFDTAPDGGP